MEVIGQQHDFLFRGLADAQLKWLKSHRLRAKDPYSALFTSSDFKVLAWEQY